MPLSALGCPQVPLFSTLGIQLAHPGLCKLEPDLRRGQRAQVSPQMESKYPRNGGGCSEGTYSHQEQRKDASGVCKEFLGSLEAGREEQSGMWGSDARRDGAG